MNTEPKIYINSSGLLLYVECPVEPELRHYGQLKAYQEALAASVKEGVEFQNTDEVMEIICPNNVGFLSCCRSPKECYCLKGKFLSIPAGFSVEVLTQCKNNFSEQWLLCTVETCDRVLKRKVAILKAVENSAHSFSEDKSFTKWGEDLSPEKTAKELIGIGFTVEQYEQGVQADRKRRLKTFVRVNIPVLIESEKELIGFGESVLKIMREWYTSQKGN